MHDIQQTDNLSWQNSEDKMDRKIEAINITSLSFNSIRSSIITKLETSR